MPKNRFKTFRFLVSGPRAKNKETEMKRVAIILLAFTGFFFAIYSAVPRAYASHNQIPANPAEWELGESKTPPLLPEDPEAIPPFPKEINEIINEALAQPKVFDVSFIPTNLLMGYPFPHAKIYFLVPGKMLIVLVAILDEELDLPKPDENSILEVRWTKLDSLKMEGWLNIPLLKKAIKGLFEEPGEKESDSKIKI